MEKSNVNANSVSNTEKSTSYIMLNIFTSLSQPILKPFLKKWQHKLSNLVLYSDLLTHLIKKVVQVAELAKKTKARVDDKLLCQKQKD